MKLPVARCRHRSIAVIFVSRPHLARGFELLVMPNLTGFFGRWNPTSIEMIRHASPSITGPVSSLRAASARAADLVYGWISRALEPLPKQKELALADGLCVTGGLVHPWVISPPPDPFPQDPRPSRDPHLPGNPNRKLTERKGKAPHGRGWPKAREERAN